MRLPVTQKMLIGWGGDRVFRDAELLVENGRVLDARYEPPFINGAILWNNRTVNTSLKMLPDGKVENQCPCRDSTERGIVCAHVIAAGLVLVRRNADPQRELKHQAEVRRAARMAAAGEGVYLRRASPGTAGAVRAAVRVTLENGWEAACRSGTTPIRCDIEYGGAARPADQVGGEVPLIFSREDDALLFVLEDISEGPARGRLEVNHFDFVNLVELHAGRQLGRSDGPPVAVNQARMTTHVKMDLDPSNGQLVLVAHTELPFVREGAVPLYVVAGRAGWVYAADNIWPLENLLPQPYHAIYQGPIAIPRPDVVRFLRQELPLLRKYARVESNVTEDMFAIEPATPRFHLAVKGSPASLSGTFYAQYGDLELVACKPDSRAHFGIPDPEDFLRYTVRNIDAEKVALALLGETAFKGECGDGLAPIVGQREVLNFLAGSVPSLRRRGWVVEIEGRVSPYFDSLDYATPVVQVQDAETGWFEVGFEFEDRGGSKLSHADIQRALRKGDSYIDAGGRIVLIDSDAVNSMLSVFSDCSSEEGTEAGRFRLADIYGPFVKSSLDALDGVDVEARGKWQLKASQCNREMRIEPVQLDEALDKTLRTYQKAGVEWLRFLEVNGFCGLLADEMGLGKTAQMLAWLQMERHDGAAKGKPALIVCPTSLVENWTQEASRFAPRLRMLELTGPDRHAKWERLQECDVAVTSYALLRRDIDTYVKHEFSAAVLDEAQHIKNRSTQNAVAAKTVKARHRFVLTGTPIENSVSDLWSIMDFLMPGYLGTHESFRNNYELPIVKGGADGELSQVKLRRKMRPFLLRRLRREVARELPPKIEKVSFCSLSPDQQAVYRELIRAARSRIGSLAEKGGLARNRMEILSMLTRLRQACCHLGLLQLPGLKPERPSAKLEMFFEFLDEALDGGHRMLVFSQFVSMLQIIREELDRRGLEYCYLDGSTKDRMSVVRTFNTERRIPMFLISLKAGGTGLNLVGADTVVHFDPWWNPAVEDQATDRAYRIGQQRTVYSLKLITKGTVEEKVLALQEKKRTVINGTIESDEKMIQSLTWDDIQSLLSI